MRLADEAYALGGQTAAESYLDTDKILDVIERSGADGVHPGYGFFSENTDFARAITARGVAFIGPPPEAIEVMGDKVSSRIAAAGGRGAGRARHHRVPQPRPTRSSPSATSTAGRWRSRRPTAAAAGACGWSSRPTWRAAALESAQSEALKGFGRSECYVERYLTWPRHVEMQVFADTHGNAVWVGERDCSAQRRHQKLVEESPAPNFPDEVRQAMGEAAVKVTKACGYVNAGTVEFLFQDGEFYFLEMNTRLQVEHPVTELVTQLDLVAEQIRVASGEPLSFTQGDIVRRGHAIEVRVNAEDPAGGKFLPSPGPVSTLKVPQGFGVRWDGGYEAGDEVSQYYDNLVGKLIVWGSDRQVAIARMLRALDEFEIGGIATTIPADKAILAHPDFAAGEHSTKWVEDRLDLSSVGLTALPGALSEDGDSAEPKVRRDVDVEVNGKRFGVTVWVPESQAAAVVAGGAAGGRVATKRKRSAASASGGAGSGDVTVPMQGTIVKVLVAAGDSVDVGQTVCVLEAMKMENNIAAEKAGTIAELRVEAGQSVGSGDVIATIE